jgi:hypothetical protein
MKQFKKTMKFVLAFTVAAQVIFTSAVKAADTLSFQLMNKANGLLLRPENASKKDGARIVLYPQQDWRCLSWDAIPVKNGGYYFRNYFTNKTVAFNQNKAEQQPVNTEQPFLWKLIKVRDDYYKIVSAADETKVLAASTDEKEQVELQNWNGGEIQLWKLLPKPVHFTG